MSVLNKIIKEVDEILYILNDEDLYPSYQGRQFSEYWGSYILLKIESPSIKNVYDQDYFLEFLERFNNICKLNGRTCSVNINNGHLLSIITLSIHETNEKWENAKDWYSLADFLHDVSPIKSYSLNTSVGAKLKHIKLFNEGNNIQLVNSNSEIADIVKGRVKEYSYIIEDEGYRIEPGIFIDNSSTFIIEYLIKANNKKDILIVKYSSFIAEFIDRIKENIPINIEISKSSSFGTRGEFLFAIRITSNLPKKKHIKPLTESINIDGPTKEILENVIDRVKELSYILEDEGILVYIDYMEAVSWGKYIVVRLECDFIRKVIVSEYYLEFLERVNSICKSHDLLCSVEDTNSNDTLSMCLHSTNKEWDRIKTKNGHGKAGYYDADHYIKNDSIEDEEMKHIKPLTEVIKLDIKVGDVVLGGRFKNKKIKVKKIGKNKKGDLTLNGKPLLRFRIIDQESIKEHMRDIADNKKYDLTDINKLKLEVEEISFIMRDVNVEPNIRISSSGAEGPWISIDLTITSDDNRKIINLDEYNEFFDRIKEIADRYDYKAVRDKDVLLIFILPKKYNQNLGMMEESSNQEKFVIDKMLSEIKSLEYILNDDNLEIELLPRYSESPTGNAITIKFTPPKEDWEERFNQIQIGKINRSDVFRNNRETYQKWLHGLVKRESYKEYYDRVKDIVNDNGYVIENNHKYDIEIYHKESTIDDESFVYEQNKWKSDDINKMKKEIDDISYIFSDIGVRPPKVDIARDRQESWIDINFLHARKVTEHEEYFEYFDRVGDIASKYGFKTLRRDGDGSGYIFIYKLGHDMSNFSNNKLVVFESKKEPTPIEKVKNEIEEILFILKDVDIILPQIDAYNREVEYKSWIDINFTISNRTLVNSEEYLEFYDRVKDISEKYGFKCYRDPKSGYIFICEKDFKVKDSSNLVLESKTQDSIIDNILVELKELEWILNDDGFSITKYITLFDPSRGMWINFALHNSEKNSEKLDIDKDSYIEWRDRIEDICVERGYKIAEIPVYGLQPLIRFMIFDPHFPGWSDIVMDDKKKLGAAYVAAATRSQIEFTKALVDSLTGRMAARNANSIHDEDGDVNGGDGYLDDYNESLNFTDKSEKRGFEALEREIRELEYILNDESIEILNYGRRWDFMRGVWINISVKTPGIFDNTHDKWVNDISKNESFLEWVDRVRDVCEKHGYKISVKTNVSLDVKIYNPNYIGWKNIRENKVVEVKTLTEEIKDLEWILEDEGYSSSIKSDSRSLDSYPGFSNPVATLLVVVGKHSGGNYGYEWKHVHVNDMEKDSISEYIDRVAEICVKHGCELLGYEKTLKQGGSPGLFVICQKSYFSNK